jgi:P-type Ca2+ transporter type 2C
MTGKSDVIKKITYDECVGCRNKVKAEEGDNRRGHHLGSMGDTGCFLVSGRKVLEGMGSYIVVAVGTMSFHGRIMISLCWYIQYLGLNHGPFLHPMMSEFPVFGTTWQ